MTKKNLLMNLAWISLGTVLLVSCNAGRNNPGKIYMPDMYYARSYESYTFNPNFADSMTNRLPVPGTVSRGHTVNAHELLPYNLAKSDSDYILAAKVQNPLLMTQPALQEGGRLFDIYCAICHGPNLDGQGPLFKSGKFPVQPANFHLPLYHNMAEGTMFYSVTYGKNLMGSYASQLSQRQRWMVIAYIKSVQANDQPDTTAAPAK